MPGGKVTFARQLKRLRKRLGLTQAQAAEALDVGFSTYRSWERGDQARLPLAVTQEGAITRLERQLIRRKSEP